MLSRYFRENALCFPPSLSPFTPILTPPHTSNEGGSKSMGGDSAGTTHVSLAVWASAATPQVKVFLPCCTHCDKIAKMTNVPRAVIACACSIDSLEKFALARTLAPCAILAVFPVLLVEAIKSQPGEARIGMKMAIVEFSVPSCHR